MKKIYFIPLLIFVLTNELIAQEQGVFFNPSPISGSGSVGAFTEIHFQMTDFFKKPVETLGYLDAEKREPGHFEIIGPDAGAFDIPGFNYPFIGVDPFIIFNPASPGTKEATLVVHHSGPGGPDSVRMIAIAGVALEPDLVIQETGPIDFGGVNLGSSSYRTVTLRNQGNQDLTISELQWSRAPLTDFGQFQIQNADVPMVIPPLESVVLDIVFAPTSPATDGVGATLTIISNDPDGYKSIDLKATESEPNITVQDAFAFGRTTMGDSTEGSITISNTADGVTDGDLVITGVSFSGANATAFSSTSTFPMVIAPGSSDEINLQFLPETKTPATATVTIDGNKTAQISLTGEGTVQYLEVASDIDFGTVRWGDVTLPHFERIQLVSEGAEDITVTDVRFIGDATDLAVSSAYLPVIAPGGIKSIDVELRSTATIGKKTAALEVTSDAVNSPHIVEVNYNIVYPVITLSDTQISMSGTAGTAQEANFSITNTGTDRLSVVDINLEGTNAGNFELIDLPAEIVAGNVYFLPVGESLIVKVRCPSITDNLTANVAINALDEDQSMAYVTVNANLLEPVVTLSENSLNFGDAFSTQATVDKSFVITNSGTIDLNISDIQISGTSASAFSSDAIALPLTVAPGNSQPVNVHFSPQSSGVKNARINVVSNEIGSPATLPLTGRGVAPVVDIAATINMGEVAIDKTSSEHKVDLRNTGLYPLSISSVRLTGSDAALFTMQPTATPLTIAPGESASFFFTFSPQAAGTYSAQLEVQSNALNSPSISALTGKGIPQAEIYYDPDPVIFPTIDIGDPGITKYVVFENRGSADLHLARAVFVGNGFSNTENFGMPKIIPPGSKDSLKVVYWPQTGGVIEAHLNVYSENNWLSKIASVPLQGYARSSDMIMSTNNLYFGTTSIGNTDTLSVEIKNDGEMDLQLDYMPPDENAIFQVYYHGMEYPSSGPSYVPVTVPPGASQKVDVVFKPEVLGPVESTIDIIYRSPFNETTAYPVTVRGAGKEPEQVTVGAIVLKADTVIDYSADVKLLRGNVHSEKLNFTGDVLVNTVTNAITGTGDVYISDIPKIGNYGGDIVKLQESGFAYQAQHDAAELVIQGGLSGVSGAFQLMGLPLEITKFNLISDGVRIGGNLTLPPKVFGPNAGIFIDSLEITSTQGVQVVGSASLTPQMKIQSLIRLNKAYVTFNTIEDNFTGGGEIGFNVLNRGVNIGAGIVIKKGLLDAITMEVEVSPGIPLGATGWSLAGGNGYVKGLQTPPLSLGLGVDLRPTVPAGGAEVIRMDNMTIAYTFGTSFEGSGMLQIFGQNVSGGNISIALEKISVQAFVNLFQIFKGNMGVAMTYSDNDFYTEGSANLSVTIPRLENCSVCDIFKELLPYKIADAAVYFNNTKISADVAIHLVFVDVGLTVAVYFENPGVRVEVGANLSILNDKVGRMATARVSNADGLITYEHDEAEMERNRLEGQSILVNAGRASNARTMGAAETTTEFTFDIDRPYKTLFIRVVGENEAPDFSVILPTGQEITAGNAEDLGVYHSINADKDLRAYVLNNALTGQYKLKINGSGTHEIDFFGTEFGPELAVRKVVYDETSEELSITWTDEDRDSDAKISWFYDTDQKGSDGLPIVRGIAENSETDHFIWETDTLKNGTYYIYGVIDDGMNTPVSIYFSEPFTVYKPSPVPAPVLDAPVIRDDVIHLSWTAVEEASHYLIYYGEDTVTLHSRNLNTGLSGIIEYGDVIYYELSTLEKGRDYYLAVTAVTDDFVASNLSNIHQLEYVSTTVNNIPEITSDVLVNKAVVRETYQTVIAYRDADPDDVHTLALTKAPDGMSINQDGMISWAPGDAQVGQHEVNVTVTDSQGAMDSIGYFVTVFDEKSSQGTLSINDYRFNGTGEEAIITLTDPGLNQDNLLPEQALVAVYSGFDKAGITLSLKETGINTGVFKGSFTFGLNNSDEARSMIGVAATDTVFLLYEDQQPRNDVNKFVLYEASEVLNNFPAGVLLNNDVIFNEVGMSDLIGKFSTIDADEKDTHSYSFVPGVGSENNGLFIIDGQELKANAHFEMEEDSVFMIRVRTTDSQKGYYEQAFVLRKENVTSVNDNYLAERIDIYPNPAAGKLVVEVRGAGKGSARITLLSLEGKKIRSRPVSIGKKAVMDISDLLPGVYFIKIEQRDETLIKKLMKK